MTAPYAAKAAELIRGSLRHEVAVTAQLGGADPFVLPAEDVTVTMSEDWAPYVQADIKLSVPARAQLDALDPRLNCRLRIDAGYTYPDNQTDVHLLADLDLRSRDDTRPDNMLGLEAASAEARAQDYRAMWLTNIPLTGLNEAAAWALDFTSRPGTPKILSAFGPRSFTSNLEGLAVEIGQDMWSILDGLAARTGTRIWCDEYRNWRIDWRPSLAGTPALHLTHGEAGTLVHTSDKLDREEWYNAAIVRHRWSDDAGAHEVTGYAQVVGGDMSVDAVGRRCYLEASDTPINQAGADMAASTRLDNLVSRGRRLTVTAIAAYWLRPGMTICITLPNGDEGVQLVQSVSFRPAEGLMTVVTRQPSNATITNKKEKI